MQGPTHALHALQTLNVTVVVRGAICDLRTKCLTAWLCLYCLLRCSEQSGSLAGLGLKDPGMPDYLTASSKRLTPMTSLGFLRRTTRR